MPSQQRKKKDQDAFDDILNNLEITDRESPIKSEKQKISGVLGNKRKLRSKRKSR